MTDEVETKQCTKCGKEGRRWGSKMGTLEKYKVYFDGPFYCDNCEESFCDQCSSHNLEYYDDGEGYPPNILCKDCEHWPQ